MPDTLYTFCHVPFTDLEAAGISLSEGIEVTISAYVISFPNGTTRNIAFSIAVGDVTYTWHPNEPKAGAADSTATTIDCPNTNCPGCDTILIDYDYNYDHDFEYNYNHLEPGPHKK